MPTGYTATLMEEGQSLGEFLLTCSRGMGATIHLRDEPFTPGLIPKLDEGCDYYDERLTETRKEIEDFATLSREDILKKGRTLKRQDLAYYKKHYQEAVASQIVLDDMTEQVKAWNPPTPDHVGLKEFMLQQLEVSKEKPDYYLEQLEKSKNTKPLEYYAQYIAKISRDLFYYEKEGIKEKQRVESRNKWIVDLVKSIKDLGETPLTK